MASIYAQAQVCDDFKCIDYNPDIENIFKNSRNYDQLLSVWKGWHDVTGRKMREIYTQTVEIENKGARENGYKNLMDVWIEEFQVDNFEKIYDDLFYKIKPIYYQLHMYVKNKLKSYYGNNYPPNHDERLIPAHLLGNIWSQNWEHILDIVLPYANAPTLDLTSLLIKRNYTVKKLFKVKNN